MKAGHYRADLLLPGDVLEHGATVVDCVGAGSSVLLTVRRTDKTESTITLPREMPVAANYKGASQ